MRGERGQATVEWVGIVLLLAVALAALIHFAPEADGRDLGRAVARSVTRPVVRPAARATAPAQPPGDQGFAAAPRDQGFAIPPLIPRAGQSGDVRIPDVRIHLPRARNLMRRARAGAGTAWRRAWIACLVYERFRYALLHPESRFPGHTIPPSEVLRMVNDCISPLDLVRDWPLMRGQ